MEEFLEKALERSRKFLANPPEGCPGRFLFLTISGAHLYGFPSPDSDIDLRGAHVLPLRQILGLKKPLETFEVMGACVDGVEIDCVTHDVGKYLRLLLKKNGYVLEQIFSPLIAFDGGDLSTLRRLARGAMTRHLVHHYKGFFATQEKLALKSSSPTAKAVLYLFRVAMTGIHLLRTGEVEANILKLNDQAFRLPFIADLVARKVAGSERGVLSPVEFQGLYKEAKRLEAQLDEAFAGSALPEKTQSLDELEEFLVRVRLEGA